MAGDPRWHSLASYALATGIALFVMFVAVRVLVVPDDAPLHQWAGLVQRVVLAVWFPCLIVLAHRLIRVTRTGAPTRGTPTSPLAKHESIAPPPDGDTPWPRAR